MASSFLSSLDDNDFTSNVAAGVYLIKTHYTGWTKSGMSSGYARSFPRMEYLTRQIGHVTAGSEGTSYFSSPSQLTGNTGWGMLAFSARDLDETVGVVETLPSVAPPSDYDGTLYTLTSVGDSSSSGGGFDYILDVG